MSRMIRSVAWVALASALLVACGGSDDPASAPTTKGSFSALVTFGDSLSDLGTYAPATSLAGNGTAPYFGGKFTANATDAKVWVENLATTLALVTTPAEVGFAGSSVKCPAAATAALAATCTGYGQGGARVTDPAGIGKSAGALTVPVKTQIANHLARFTAFKASDLILVWAGNNDAFVQFEAFSTAATLAQTQAAGGAITAAQAQTQIAQAQATAEAAMKLAAQELVGYVKSEILAKGGLYVAVLNLPDSTQTPFGATLPASVKPVLSALVDTFNRALAEGLTDQPVKLIDQNTAGKAVAADPAKYGLANSTVPTCDIDKIKALTGNQITDGSSLFCNSTAAAPYNGLRTGADVNTWQFADGVHPTPGGHKIISDTVTAQLRAFGWI